MIYLDNAATTRPDYEALRYAEEYLTERYFNPSAVYQAGHALANELKLSRKAILSKIADVNLYDLVITSCGSESDNQAIFSCARRGNAVTTAGEHSAVVNAFNELKNRNVEVRIAPLNADGSVNASELLKLIDEKTCFVSVMHVNNETGAINDVNSIAKKIKAKYPRVIFHSDGVQAFGKIPYKLGKDVDLYSVSAHKIGGLKGVGALIKKKSLSLRPYIFGGGQEGGLRSGTENVFGIKVFEHAAERRYASINENFEAVKGLKSLLLQGLDESVFGVISSPDASPYVVSLYAKGLRGEILLHVADDRGLLISTGSACSSNDKLRYSRVILACGYDKTVADGVIRVSFSSDTSKEDVLEAVRILNASGKDLQQRMR